MCFRKERRSLENYRKRVGEGDFCFKLDCFNSLILEEKAAASIYCWGGKKRTKNIHLFLFNHCASTQEKYCSISSLAAQLRRKRSVLGFESKSSKMAKSECWWFPKGKKVRVQVHSCSTQCMIRVGVFFPICIHTKKGHFGWVKFFTQKKSSGPLTDFCFS